MRRSAGALLLAGWPTSAAAHDAFGDPGPFFRALVHPLADPAQAIVLVAAALLLARQPIATVRPAFAALLVGVVAVLAAGVVTDLPVPPARILAAIALAVAGVALAGRRVPGPAVVGLALSVGTAAALPLDNEPDGASALAALAGGAAGIALATLFVWGGADWADRRVSPLASAVAAAWLAAIALMAIALPG